MKAVIKFLLHTGAGRMILELVIGLIFRALKKRVDEIPAEKKEVLNDVLELVRDQIKADDILSDLKTKGAELL